MKLSRREALRLIAAAGAAPYMLQLAGCDDDTDDDPGLPELPEYSYEGPMGPDDLFLHGVASGDPLSDAVILWTRVTSADAPSTVDVWWEIAADAAFESRLQVGTFTTSADRDWTVKLDVTELVAGVTYYYRFKALGVTSPVGRTRTAPEGAVDQLRFAIVSGSSYAHGYFHVYEQLAKLPDLDAVLHLGDYIYEYGNDEYGSVRRLDPPHELLTLEDYRLRHGQHKADLSSIACHRQHPLIAVWDDHETADNSWTGGADNHNEGEGDWEVRKAAGMRAYFEWMPIREQPDKHIYRTFPFGDLADLVMLDTRLLGRSAPIETIEDRTAEDRQMLGEEQEAWLREQLTTSTARWRLLGQQIMVGQLSLNGLPLSEGGGAYVNMDQWDGHEWARQRLFDIMEEDAAANTVVLTGDIHSSWAIELTRDPVDPEIYDPAHNKGPISVEFVAPAVTSPGLANLPAHVRSILEAENPHIKWFDLVRRGYVVLDISRERIQGDWFLFDDTTQVETTMNFAAAYAVAHDEPKLTAVDAPVPPRNDRPELV